MMFGIYFEENLNLQYTKGEVGMCSAQEWQQRVAYEAI